MAIEVMTTVSTIGLPVVRGEESYVDRIKNFPIPISAIKDVAKYLGVTENFKKVIDYFKVKSGDTPAGFQIKFLIDSENVLRADLVRNISYDKNGIKRPTDLLFSADSANPYEIAPIKNLIANLTCNPGIIYDLFINNPEANIGNKFKNRDEVMQEIGNILGPGTDISVELNDPFGKSYSEILEEAAKFKEILSEYRVVIKVPHTGPVNKDNVKELLSGDKKFSKRYNEVSTEDAFLGHNLALMLHENGYRVNFTLMFEPYQTALALQARPYFINSFIRHRKVQSQIIKECLDKYTATQNQNELVLLREFLEKNDYLSSKDTGVSLNEILDMSKRIIRYRNFENHEGSDGLDMVRSNLRMLRHANLPDTRLIICSMEGPDIYPDIDKLMTEEEFADMIGRVVITAEPNYLAQFTSTNQVISYQRRFMNAANGMS